MSLAPSFDGVGARLDEQDLEDVLRLLVSLETHAHSVSLRV